MPDNVETMMYAFESEVDVPWHKNGNPVRRGITSSAEAMKAAGCDWEVTLIPLFTQEGEEVTHKAVKRVTDSRILGVVGPRFVPLQNVKAFEWFDPILEKGDAWIETAGSLRNGSRIWVLAALNREPIVVRPGDEVKKYLMLSHGHDGTLSVNILFTAIRVVCSNTEAMARDGATAKLRGKHTANLITNLEAIRDVINIADASFKATAEQYKRLAAKGINQKDVLRYVEIVFGFDAIPEGDRSKQSLRLVDDIMNRVYSKAKGNGQDTVWDAYNGVTEYLSWGAGRNEATRLDSLWFGPNANLNQKALDTALELAVA